MHTATATATATDAMLCYAIHPSIPQPLCILYYLILSCLVLFCVFSLICRSLFFYTSRDVIYRLKASHVRQCRDAFAHHLPLPPSFFFSLIFSSLLHCQPIHSFLHSFITLPPSLPLSVPFLVSHVCLYSFCYACSSFFLLFSSFHV